MKDLLELYQFDDHTDRILVTCALPYVNNVPHLGNLVPIVSADVYARFLKLKGIPSLYICATDEHGTRTEIEAKKAGLDEDTYCKQIHSRMLEIFEWFHVDFTHFGRTSCPENHEITQQLFLQADEHGYVELQENQQLYCDTCEQFLPDTYVEGICPHCNTPGAKGDQCDTCGKFLDPFELINPRCKTCGSPPEARQTRHLYLRLDALAPHLKAWIESLDHWDGDIRGVPLGWVEEGLRPRGITRDLKWGVKVPKEGFEDKVFYVWFDAPIGYIAATAEWAKQSGASLDDWWKGGKARLIHFLGKDNVPFHTIMWPGTLIASRPPGDDGVPELGDAEGLWNLPTYIPANQYLNYEGGAFSKSRNQGVFSDDVVQMDFPADAFRFFLIANRPEKRDTDFSWEAFQATVNTALVGNIGNLSNRAVSFIAKKFKQMPEPGELLDIDLKALADADAKLEEIDRAYQKIELRAAARLVLELSDIGNVYVQETEFWSTFKTDEARCKTTLFVACKLMEKLARACWPIMPERCEELLRRIGASLEQPVTPGAPIAKTKKYLFSPIPDERIEELTEKYKGAGGQKLGPLEFEKQPGVTWPCVILELTELNIKRRSGPVQRWKEEQFASIDLDAIEASDALAGYLNDLDGRDGGRVVSVQNLVNIGRREGKLPTINTLVDIYNTYSLKESIVMGAYERRTIQGKLIYAEADGQEHFIPVKGEGKEPIQPGEWVLKDETNMVVTKVTTKQSAAAAVTPETTACAMCIQGNEVIDLETLQRVAHQVGQTITAFCGGQYRVVFEG